MGTTLAARVFLFRGHEKDGSAGTCARATGPFDRDKESRGSGRDISTAPGPQRQADARRDDAGLTCSLASLPALQVHDFYREERQRAHIYRCRRLNPLGQNCQVLQRTQEMLLAAGLMH
jgi:hypothetical protein